MLWPDAEGDLAHKSFEMTLSRLRRLLGGNGFIKSSAKQLGIDPLHCWVDSFVLDRVLEKTRKVPANQVAHLCEKAFSLHKGPFLPADTSLHWALSRREALKNGLLRATLAAGRYYEDSGQWERAAECYLQGLDTDNVAEELYQRLMVCYNKLGNRTTAVKTYNRCRAILQAEFGLEPSTRTEAIYSSIVERP